MCGHEAEVSRRVPIELGYGVTEFCSSICRACGREGDNLWRDHIHGMGFGSRLIERHIAIETLASHPPLMGAIWYHRRCAVNQCKMLLRRVCIVLGALKCAIRVLLLVLLQDLRRNLVGRLSLAFLDISLSLVLFSRVFA